MFKRNVPQAALTIHPMRFPVYTTTVAGSGEIVPATGRQAVTSSMKAQGTAQQPQAETIVCSMSFPAHGAEGAAPPEALD
jgi:hypothetical protein